MKYKLEPLANYHCECGENPLWDEKRQAVYWTDIPKGRIYRYDTLTGKHRAIYEGEPVGGFTLQSDDTLLLFRTNNLARLDPDGKVTPLGKTVDVGNARFNDVIADPKGRVFAGTAADDSKVGGLFRIDLDGRGTRVYTGTSCSNGMAFSHDLRHLYWTCSEVRKIFRFDFNIDTGELANRVEFISVPKDGAIPDGMTMDADGNFWSARWDGFAVVKHAPDGEKIGQIDFPVAKVSSVIFGGKKLNDLYVTTAGGTAESASADGTLYRVKTKARGTPEFRSRVCLG